MLTELTITDITRMSGNFICVAGIDRNGKTIRPLYKDKRIDQDWCCVEGREIRQFTRIMINLETPRPLPPHTEDYHIGPEIPQILGDCSSDEKLALLKRNCSKDIASIFGADIQHVTGRNIYPIKYRKLLPWHGVCQESFWFQTHSL
jgi:hypothetical protein